MWLEQGVEYLHQFVGKPQVEQAVGSAMSATSRRSSSKVEYGSAPAVARSKARSSSGGGVPQIAW